MRSNLSQWTEIVRTIVDLPRFTALMATGLIAGTLATPALAQAGRGAAGPIQTFNCGELAGRNVAGASILSSGVVAPEARKATPCRSPRRMASSMMAATSPSVSPWSDCAFWATPRPL